MSSNSCFKNIFSSADIPTTLPDLEPLAAFLAGTSFLAFIFATAGASCFLLAAGAFIAASASLIALSIAACSLALCSGVVEKSYTGRSDLFGVVVMGVIMNDGLRDGMRR